jgi:hypothetical protein
MSFRYDTILDAIKANDLDGIKIMVNNGVEWSENTLIIVAIKGYLSILQTYIELGYTIDKWSVQLVSYSAIYGQLEIVKYLDQLGYKCNETSLALAAERGHIEVVKYCIENGCKCVTPYVTTNAAAYGHLEILKYCISKGCPYDEDYILTEIDENENDGVIDSTTRAAIMDYIFSLECSTNNKSVKRSQYYYYKELNTKDKLALKMYTGNVFFRSINAYHQSLLDISMVPSAEEWIDYATEYCKLDSYSFKADQYTQEELEMFIDHLSNNINQIIQNAPPLEESIVVYRGVKTPYFMYDYQRQPNDTFCHKGFISTTLSRKRAYHYAESNYIMKAELKKGTKCVYYPIEKEIILPLNTKVKIVSKMVSDNLIGAYNVEFFSIN